MKKTILIHCISLVFTQSLWAQKSWIRINQLGYTPKSVKIAVLASQEDITIDSYHIIDVLTAETVFRSKNIKSYNSYACFKNIYRLDFSDFCGIMSCLKGKC